MKPPTLTGHGAVALLVLACAVSLDSRADTPGHTVTWKGFGFTAEFTCRQSSTGHCFFLISNVGQSEPTRLRVAVGDSARVEISRQGAFYCAETVEAPKKKCVEQVLTAGLHDH